MSWKDYLPKENRFYETKNGILYHGDCVDLLRLFPSETVDLVIIDPPFMVSAKNTVFKGLKIFSNRTISLDFGEWDRAWENEGEYYDWVEKWFAEGTRVMKMNAWIYIFFAKERLGIFHLHLSPRYGIKSRTIFTWIKPNPLPSVHKTNWRSGTEFVYVGSKGEGGIKNYLDQDKMVNYMILYNGGNFKQTKHPTEKPEPLIKRFVLANSNEGDLVLDFFAGSGTTLAVCEKYNRRWIGIEMNEEYCQMAKNRLEEIVSLKNQTPALFPPSSDEGQIFF